MRLTSIASGSSGNCIYIGSDTTHLLVDVGISGKRIEAGVNSLDLSMKDIDGILITHEHSDHIGGLGVIARKYGIPIFSSPKTINAIKSYSQKIGEIDSELFCEIYPEDKLTIKDIVINPMKVSHDAVDPLAYRFKCGSSRAAVVTDLGKFDEYTVESLKNMNVLFLEANHDVNMLQVGPYPYYLKKRILSDRGHLCNEACGSLLSKLLHDDLKTVFLGHLSKENNMPELCYEAVRLEVTANRNNLEGSCIGINDICMHVAKRSEPSELAFF